MQPLDQERQNELVRRLFDATEGGRLGWQPGQVGDRETSKYFFKVSIHRFGYVIRSVDQDDNHPISLTVWELSTANPLEVQVISSYDGEATPSVVSGLFDLYSIVKRSTLKLDSVAQSIFDELDSL